MASALSACGGNTSGAPNRTRHVREAGMVGGEEHGPARKRPAGLLDDDAVRHAGAGDQAERGTQDVPEQPGGSSLGQGTLLRDTMASLRWTFWEQNGVFSRADLDVGAERQKLLLALEEYPTLDWAYEQSCIFEA